MRSAGIAGGTLDLLVRGISIQTVTLQPEVTCNERTGRVLLERNRRCRAQHLAFCHFLRGQLRNIDAAPDARQFIGTETEAVLAYRNRPDDLLRRIGRRLGDLKRRGLIEAMDFRILDERVSSLAAVQAGCERISTTPLPVAYTLLLHRSAYVFCLLLPFGLAFLAGWSTPLFTMLVAYSFFGLDALSEELEDPFGLDSNDLALDALCRVCEISVFEALGEPAPEPVQALDFIYS